MADLRASRRASPRMCPRANPRDIPRVSPQGSLACSRRGSPRENLQVCLQASLRVSRRASLRVVRRRSSLKRCTIWKCFVIQHSALTALYSCRGISQDYQMLLQIRIGICLTRTSTFTINAPIGLASLAILKGMYQNFYCLLLIYVELFRAVWDMLQI